MALSKDSTQAYTYQWEYLKRYITDVTNVNQTIEQLNSITTTARGKPVTIYTKRNYMTALLNQIRNLPDLKKEYLPYTRQLITDVTKITKHQICSDSMKDKLKDIVWSDIIHYKQQIIDSKSISAENKLLVRLYTELDAPVRNDFAKIRVFIDEPRPVDYVGNCIMLTKKPIVIKYKKLRVIKKAKPIDELIDSSNAVIYPVRNVLWLSEFKTSKHESVRDIVQQIPDHLSTDIMNHCLQRKTNILFNTSEHSIANRIRNMFYQVSNKRIGINVMRHLFVMNFMKDTPWLDTRKQTASMMGHNVNTQELYRLKMN